MSFSFTGKFPVKRPRRMRRDDFSRRMMRETRLSADDFIYPVFVVDGARREEPVPSLPGVARKSIDLLFADAERCLALGVPAMALFPVVPQEPACPRWRCSRSCRRSRSRSTPRPRGTRRGWCRARCAR